MPFSELRILEIHSFPHFSPTYFLTYSVEILYMTLFSFFFSKFGRESLLLVLIQKMLEIMGKVNYKMGKVF